MVNSNSFYILIKILFHALSNDTGLIKIGSEWQK